MNNVLEKLKAPAIGLIVIGALNGVTGLLTLLGGAVRLTGILGPESLPADEAEKTGFLIGTAFGYGVALLSLAAAPVIIYGALKMLRGNSYALARTSAILAIVPLVSCCFIIGIPLGVWALMVLNQPDVRAFFEGGSADPQFYPPKRV